VCRVPTGAHHHPPTASRSHIHRLPARGCHNALRSATCASPPLCAAHVRTYDAYVRYRAIYPVFTEKIHVHGRQWVEPISPSSCYLHAKIRVKVDIAIVGGTIEKWIETLIRKAYVDLPIQCAHTNGARMCSSGARMCSSGARICSHAFNSRRAPSHATCAHAPSLAARRMRTQRSSAPTTQRL
jgi:hypothetical protein